MRSRLTVNAAAIRANATRLAAAAGTAQLMVVVKANGYGHGAVQSARAALDAGASALAVASVAEGAALRAALAGGPHSDVPILVLGSLTSDELAPAVQARLQLSAWTPEFVGLVATESASRGATTELHVKLDSGLGRLGTRDAAIADRVADLAARQAGVVLSAGWTHLATADEPGDEFFGQQLQRFAEWGRALKARHPGIRLHAANSAATLRDSGSHFDLVRCGVALYGLDPFGIDAADQGLTPAMSLSAAVGAVKGCSAGQSVGYGRRFVAERDTTIVTIPIGYGDGYRRLLSDRAEVLIGGVPMPVRGTISMDNITVEVPAGAEPPKPGDEAVLLGISGRHRITAEQLARHANTINYEITCGFTDRPQRTWAGL